MFIKRIAEIKLKDYLTKNKIIIILGARQVGKTTLIEEMVKNLKVKLLNLDIEVDKSRLTAAFSLPPSEAKKSFDNPDIFIVDEAQRLPEISRIVKGWYDAHLPLKVILLGSSSLNILDQSAENLTGRNIKLYLPPLIFKEVITNQSWYVNAFSKKIISQNFSNQVDSLISQLITYGSYPETIVTSEKEQYLLNLVSDYLLKDIYQLNLIKSSDIIKKLLLLLAYQIGSEVSVNELSKTLQVSRVTINKYLDLLEKTFVIFRLPAFNTNQRKEITKNNKIYFWDTGVRNALIKDFSFFPNRSDLGHLWENWVIAEVAKKNLLEGERYNLYFWRNTDGSEIDLIIKGSNIFKAYEIKWSKINKIINKSFTNKYKIKATTITKNNILDLVF